MNVEFFPFSNRLAERGVGALVYASGGFCLVLYVYTLSKYHYGLVAFYLSFGDCFFFSNLL